MPGSPPLSFSSFDFFSLSWAASVALWLACRNYSQRFTSYFWQESHAQSARKSARPPKHFKTADSPWSHLKVFCLRVKNSPLFLQIKWRVKSQFQCFSLKAKSSKCSHACQNAQRLLFCFHECFPQRLGQNKHCLKWERYFQIGSDSNWNLSSPSCEYKLVSGLAIEHPVTVMRRLCGCYSPLPDECHE